jgi:HEAT repeat protein
MELSRFFLVIVFLLSACCKEEKIPKLSRDLYSSSSKDRNDAALELARCGSAASKTVSRLGQLLYDENIGVQSAAAYALRKIDTKEARAILKRAEERRSNS